MIGRLLLDKNGCDQKDLLLVHLFMRNILGHKESYFLQSLIHFSSSSHKIAAHSLTLQEAFAEFDIISFSHFPKQWAGSVSELQQLTDGLFRDWCCSEGQRSHRISF